MAELEWLTHADFADRVGDRFEVPDAGLVLRLEAATESAVPGGPDPQGRTRNQFSLVFTGPIDTILSQGTVSLVHRELGELGLFLVPLGPRGDVMQYEAAFA